MKIEVVSFTGDSGLADYSVSLARALSALVRTTVVTARSLPARFDQLGFEVLRVFRRSRHYPIDLFRFLFGVLRRRPAWVIFQGPLKFALLDGLCVRTLRVFGIQCCITVHDVLPHYPRPWSKTTFGFYYRSFDRVICHSQSAKAGVEALGVRAPILVVPHGIYDIFNLTQISQQAAREKIPGIEPQDFVTLFFGHLEPRKGLLEFLTCAKQFADVPRFKFLLAGASSVAGHGPQYAAALNEAKLMPNVVLHDRRIPFEEVENFVAASNVISLPYLEGTTSGVLKIALAFALPVVATRVGDFPEQVPAGAGLFIDADNQIATNLGLALREMEQNYDQFQTAMSVAGQDAQWPLIAQQLLDFLQRK
ncbi:glycosyltransferase family 4 protein [Chitinibacter sp. ZOR0017]|uniref:glycosyltransferase family 4 protein n=1 Tax=Chitinibacter sp. ZOR0017 TaxID=1339254 RepID=UPI0009DCE9A5|nr:glycosyltransferase family 4 protein [Chitinibacter sp. ZOR0017]